MSRAYSYVGLALPVPLLFLAGMPTAHEFWLIVVIGLVAIVSDRLTIEFSFGGDDIPVTPDVVAWVIAAVFLPPEVAMFVALASIVPALGDPIKSVLANTGSLALSLGIASAVSHLLLGPPQGMLTLLLGLVAALVFQLFYVGEGLMYLESKQPGAAREHIEHSRVVTGFEVFLPTVGVAIVGPFVAQPALVGIVLVGYQVLVYAGLRVMKSEQVHRATSRFLKDTFSRYVPASVVDKLSEEQAQLTLGGEEREITVLFCDVRNFTSWSENLTPTHLITELNVLMTELAEAVFSTEGTLDKFTGDGLMAFWGAPLSQPNHAARAVNTTLEMLERVEQLNERSKAGGHTLHIGVGIHTGLAVVGNVGHVDRLDYTAIGDTVNVAARLESATKDSGCSALISGDTFAQLHDLYTLGPLEPLGGIEVKGRREPVDTYILAYGVRAPGDGYERRTDATSPARQSVPDRTAEPGQLEPGEPGQPGQPGERAQRDELHAA